MSADDVASVPDPALRSALEFAVGIAAAGQKHRPPLLYPAGLKPLLRMNRLDRAGLRAARRAVVGDPSYRERIAQVATADLVDEVGVAWLQRVDGWERRVADLLREAKQAADEASAQAAVRKAERRREAAEQAAARARAELGGHNDRLVREQARRERAEQSAATARAEIASARAEVVRLQHQLASLRAKAAAATDRAERAEAIAADLVGKLSEAERERTRGQRRDPLPIPGGVHGDSVEATTFLLRSVAAVVIVDGYNVAKLAWPRLDLGGQRDACIDLLEDVARRFGAQVHVVFDGAEVLGAAAPRRRLVRVRFSPAGVTADDVIRAEVAALPAQVAAVVVTNDQAIVNDVRGMGANVVTSGALLAAATSPGSRHR